MCSSIDFQNYGVAESPLQMSISTILIHYSGVWLERWLISPWLDSQHRVLASAWNMHRHGVETNTRR